MSKFVNIELTDETYEKLQATAKQEFVRSPTAYLGRLIETVTNNQRILLESEKGYKTELLFIDKRKASVIANPLVESLICEDNYRKLIEALKTDEKTEDNEIIKVNVNTLKKACKICNRIELKTLFALFFTDKDKEEYITLTDRNIRRITEITQRTTENLISRLQRMETNGIIEIDRENNRFRIKD